VIPVVLDVQKMECLLRVSEPEGSEARKEAKPSRAEGAAKPRRKRSERAKRAIFFFCSQHMRSFALRFMAWLVVVVVVVVMVVVLRLMSLCTCLHCE